MKNLFVPILMLFLLCSLQNGKAQTFQQLWKQVSDAEQKDLPKTQGKLLGQIAAKAEKEHAYGHLLKAELAAAKVQSAISPDSLAPAIERLKKREQSAKTLPLRAVYQAVLGRVYTENSHSLGDFKDNEALSKAYFAKAMQYPKELAAVKASAYEPFVTKGEDSRYFDDNLLGVLAYETQRFDVLHQYYLTTDNRSAQLLSALEWLKNENLSSAVLIARIDSLITIYGDLEECGEAAIMRYERWQEGKSVTPGEQVEAIDKALMRWGSWKRMNILRNYRKNLTTPMFSAQMQEQVTIPQREQMVKLVGMRNISKLTMNVYRVKADGDIQYYPGSEEDYKKIKPLLTSLPEYTQTRSYQGKAEYELFDDSMSVAALPVGVYMMEFKSQPTTQVSRSLYFVSDLRVLANAIPDNRVRYVVVNATTGQPVAGATIKLSDYGYRQKPEYLTTDGNGECIYQQKVNRHNNVFVTTAADKACPPMDYYGHFQNYGSPDNMTRIAVYTDRAIYRPGQTVQAAAILYKVKSGFLHEALSGRKVKARLRDANYKVVEEKELTTDDYGTVSTSFLLPQKTLNGRFSVEFDGTRQTFRVEEYKRPTFEVVFPKVEQDYKAGDTLRLKATAKSYAGVPVQQARVSYMVERRMAFWWMSYRRYWQVGSLERYAASEVVLQGDATTDDEGCFEVSIPLVMPESDYQQFYNFTVVADVTDIAGETHQGQLSLPLGNRNAAFTLELAEQMRSDQMGTLKMHLYNMAGNDLPATAYYQIDGGKWNEAQTNVPIVLSKLKSGQHKLTAVCGEDTVKQRFVVFSLSDKQPVIETDDWFYLSEQAFVDATTPVTLQAGSSAKNVHIVYTIVADGKLIESGAVDRSNELLNRKFTYKEEYGNGLSISLAWIREGKVYKHSCTIRRPLPDKSLQLKWQTFRDRLIPGQKEEWTLTVADAKGKAVAAQLMATLYDKSLDQIIPHHWNLQPEIWLPISSLNWHNGNWGTLYCSGMKQERMLATPELSFRRFDSSCFPMTGFGYGYNRTIVRGMGRRSPVMKMAKQANMAETEEMVAASAYNADEAIGTFDTAEMKQESGDEEMKEPEEVQVRENLQETAFFYPQLLADSTGCVTMKFTLPESLTTWRFIGIAHTQDMMYGMLEGEVVAKKDVMIQPNIPRFVRVGDQAVLSARVFNTSDKPVNGTVELQLIDPQSETMVLSERLIVSLGVNESIAPSFAVDCSKLAGYSLLICKMVVRGDGFSDGEQHYLPVLTNHERVTVTAPFVQTEPGTLNLDIPAVPEQEEGKVTIEYTNNPAWLMIQALPSVGHPHDNCAICQAASLYANSLGRYLLEKNPKVKQMVEAWKRETAEGGNVAGSTLNSQLTKNEELKDLLLSETPWVLDADRESEQRQRLSDFFDENLMNNRLEAAVTQLKKLQNADGSWSWWEGMNGSFYMTVEISEFLTRLGRTTDLQDDVRLMLNKALGYMDGEIVKMVENMRKEEKKGHKQVFPSHKALQYLYIYALNERKSEQKVTSAQQYLKKLLEKEGRTLTINDKAIASIVLKSGTFLKSLQEWTTYKEGVGRYYDTPRAGYSWRDYRIPTQVAVIEAFKMLMPNDQKTIRQMQQWLLHEKRAQAWDTPINSVNAIYAFLDGNSQVLDNQSPSVLKIDGKLLQTNTHTLQPSLGIGYVKTTIPVSEQTSSPKMFSAEKTSTGTSWGAVYVQYMQDTKDIAEQKSELSIRREIIRVSQRRIKIRLTIEAQRDMDFVEVVDRRAACMEPVNQLSGYRNGAYCVQKDNATRYFFDQMAKGKHVVETEYYLDRTGQYETGSATAQCAYAPEFRATTHSQTISIDE